MVAATKPVELVKIAHESTPDTNPALALSQALWDAAREGNTAQANSLRAELAAWPAADLAQHLAAPAAQMAFWLNLYNAFSRLTITPEALQTSRQRQQLFARRQFAIAGRMLSFNQIEHTLLRGGQAWWGLGYVRLPRRRFMRQLGVAGPPDPRLHFALNCGAASCPPIRYYTPQSLDPQLDLATRSYLGDTAHLRWDAATASLQLSPLFRWYAGDFGGRRGTLRFLGAFDLIPPNAKPKHWRYKPWNWAPPP
jgi:hypothetical protein